MRLKINKACDLSSISVLPPHSRRPNPASAAADSSIFSKMHASQLRSQSQQSFSQGLSLSQLSQGSFDEALANEQRLGSQDRDQSSKGICNLPPLTVSREDSQVVPRSSNNFVQRWSSSLPERRCQVSEELEHRFGLMENNLSRFGMILDSIQNDVMQISKSVREVMLEVESIRQKMVTHDNSLQLMLKTEDDIRASIDRILKSCSEKKVEPDESNFEEIFTLLSTLPDRIESRISTKHKELFVSMAKEIKASIVSWAPTSSVQPVTFHAQMVTSDKSVIRKKNLPVPPQTRPILPAMDHKRTPCTLNREEGIRAPSVNKQKRKLELKPEIIVLSEQDQELQVVVDLDKELDDGFSCLLQPGESYTLGDAKEETMRILRKARRRKRKFSNVINLI